MASVEITIHVPADTLNATLILGVINHARKALLHAVSLEGVVEHGSVSIPSMSLKVVRYFPYPAIAAPR
jgi:hypothetical protein